MSEELAKEQTELIAEITAAFDGVRRGDGNTLQQANWISKWVDDGEDELSEEAQAEHRQMVASVRDTAWQELSDEDIEAYNSLEQIDFESLPYYLAPFMIWTVVHYPVAWPLGMPAASTLLAICWDRAEPEPPGWKLNDWSKLNARQKAAILAFAKYVLARTEAIPNSGDIRDLRHAIDGYWHQFAGESIQPAKKKRSRKK